MSFRLIVLAALILAYCPGDAHAGYSLESLMRSYAERYKAAKAATKAWPNNLNAETAPEFPPDGFYARGVSDASTDAAYSTLRDQIVNGMYDGVNGVAAPADQLMGGWLQNGDLEGTHFDTLAASGALSSAERPVVTALERAAKEEVIARRLMKMEWQAAQVVMDYKLFEGTGAGSDPQQASAAAFSDALLGYPTTPDAELSNAGGSAPFQWYMYFVNTGLTSYSCDQGIITATPNRPTSLSQANSPTISDYRVYWTLLSPAH